MATNDHNPTFVDIRRNILIQADLEHELRAVRVNQVRRNYALLRNLTTKSAKYKDLTETFNHLEAMVHRMVFDKMIFDDILHDLEERLEVALGDFDILSL